MKRSLLLTLALALPHPALADVSAAIGYDIPLGVTLQAGYTRASGTHFYGAYSRSNLILFQLTSYEIGLSFAASENGRHRIGVGIGQVEVTRLDEGWVFSSTGEMSMLRTGYTFHPRGLRARGFELGGGLLLIDGRRLGIDMNLGYRFNWP